MLNDEATLGALLDDTGGSIKTGPFGTKLKASEYTPTGVPVISVGEVGFGRLRIHPDTPRVDESVWSRMPEFLLKPGDIVFGRKGAVERSAQVQPDEDGYFLGSDGIRIRLNGELCDPKFIAYQLQTKAHRSWMLQQAAGTTMPSLNEGIIRRIPIVLKPISEQKAIAEVLGALDDKIELNRRMNLTLGAMARALFQSWFVDFEPVRAKAKNVPPCGMDPETAALFPASFKSSGIGLIPNGWSVRDLGEIADLDKGLSYKGDGLADEGGMPMVNLGCFTGRGLFNADRVKRYTGEYRERHLVYAGDLVIANTDMTQNRVIIGSPALVPQVNGEKEFLFTHHVFAVRFKAGAEVWRRYVFFTLLKPEFREIAEGFSTGTTVLALPRDGLLNYSLCLPPIPLLEAFEKQVEPLLAAIDANLEQSRRLANVRDSLLPKLLSGEISSGEARTQK